MINKRCFIEKSTQKEYHNNKLILLYILEINSTLTHICYTKQKLINTYKLYKLHEITGKIRESDDTLN